MKFGMQVAKATGIVYAKYQSYILKDAAARDAFLQNTSFFCTLKGQ